MAEKKAKAAAAKISAPKEEEKEETKMPVPPKAPASSGISVAKPSVTPVIFKCPLSDFTTSDILTLARHTRKLLEK